MAWTRRVSPGRAWKRACPVKFQVPMVWPFTRRRTSSSTLKGASAESADPETAYSTGATGATGFDVPPHDTTLTDTNARQARRILVGMRLPPLSECGMGSPRRDSTTSAPHVRLKEDSLTRPPNGVGAVVWDWRCGAVGIPKGGGRLWSHGCVWPMEKRPARAGRGGRWNVVLAWEASTARVPIAEKSSLTLWIR